MGGAPRAAASLPVARVTRTVYKALLRECAFHDVHPLSRAMLTAPPSSQWCTLRRCWQPTNTNTSTNDGGDVASLIRAANGCGAARYTPCGTSADAPTARCNDGAAQATSPNSARSAATASGPASLADIVRGAFRGSAHRGRLDLAFEALRQLSSARRIHDDYVSSSDVATAPFALAGPVSASATHEGIRFADFAQVEAAVCELAARENDHDSSSTSSSSSGGGKKRKGGFAGGGAAARAIAVPPSCAESSVPRFAFVSHPTCLGEFAQRVSVLAPPHAIGGVVTLKGRAPVFTVDVNVGAECNAGIVVEEFLQGVGARKRNRARALALARLFTTFPLFLGGPTPSHPLVLHRSMRIATAICSEARPPAQAVPRGSRRRSESSVPLDAAPRNSAPASTCCAAAAAAAAAPLFAHALSDIVSCVPLPLLRRELSARSCRVIMNHHQWDSAAHLLGMLPSCPGGEGALVPLVVPPDVLACQEQEGEEERRGRMVAVPRARGEEEEEGVLEAEGVPPEGLWASLWASAPDRSARTFAAMPHFGCEEEEADFGERLLSLWNP